MFRRATAIQWSPTLTAHDPNPPIVLEDPAGGGGDITGTSANAQRAQTSAATGSLTVSGTAAGTQRSQTSASSGSIRVSGSSAGTQGAQTSTASGALRVSGTAVETQGAQTSTASGSVGTSDITGTSANTQAPATSSATGTVQQPDAPATGGGGKPRRHPTAWPVPRPPAVEIISGNADAILAPAVSTARGEIILAAISKNTGSAHLARANGRMIVTGEATSTARKAGGMSEGWIVDDSRDVLEFLSLVE